jgi:hypothetical protein
MSFNLYPGRPAGLPDWNAALGFRNRRVHDDIDIDFLQIEPLLMTDKGSFNVRFLSRDYSNVTESSKL